jgi:hypothetical protein
VSANLHPSAASTPTDGASSRADLLEQLKAHLDPSLFAAVSGKFNSYERELQHAQMKNQVLEERLRQLRIAKYGSGSEKLSNLRVSRTRAQARDAVPMMGDGLPKSACRSRLQTTRCCCVQKWRGAERPWKRHSMRMSGVC